VAEAGTQKTAKLKMISPQFVVPDVKVAAEYYRDVFGFKVLSYFWDPPVYSIVQTRRRRNPLWQGRSGTESCSEHRAARRQHGRLHLGNGCGCAALGAGIARSEDR
jgi:hypothetical protein